MTAVTDEDQGKGDGTGKPDGRADGRWDDGLIARRAAAAEAREAEETAPPTPAEDDAEPQVEAYAPGLDRVAHAAAVAVLGLPQPEPDPGDGLLAAAGVLREGLGHDRILSRAQRALAWGSSSRAGFWEECGCSGPA